MSKKWESKLFEISTAQGLKSAERYKERLNNKYSRVTVTPLGLGCVKITGAIKLSASEGTCNS